MCDVAFFGQPVFIYFNYVVDYPKTPVRADMKTRNKKVAKT
jgi:hypothetical protein